MGSRGKSPAADRDRDHAFVVTAFGDSPFLEACLASLRTQRPRQGRDSEIIIATSTPSLFISRAAEGFAVPVVVNEESRNIAEDWNFALEASGARFVTIAHHDDLYFDGFAERSLAALAEAADAVLCFTGYQEIDEASAPKSSKISRVKHLLEGVFLGSAKRVSGTRLRAFLSLGNPLACSSVTFDRQRLPDFAFSAEYRSNLDWDAWLRLLSQGGVFARAPERLVGRRHNPLTETSRLIREGVRQSEDLALFRRLWPKPFAELIAQGYRAGY
ncbi:MAG: glycosyltransferase [Caulobacteraceae bacterium]